MTEWDCEAAASKSAARGTLEERGSQLTAAAQRLVASEARTSHTLAISVLISA